MDRIIEVKVYGNHLTKDSNNAGTRGEANATKLRITFDKSWENLTKTFIFWDAHGQNPVSVLGSVTLMEGTTNVYLVPIPKEAMARAGEMIFSIRGEGEDSRQVSITGKLEVEDSPEVLEALPPTPNQWSQMQQQFDEIAGNLMKVNTAIDEQIPEAMIIIAQTKEDTEKAEANAIEQAEYAAKRADTAQGAAFDAGESANRAAGLADYAEQCAERAAESLGKSPYIGEDGYWYVWNDDKIEWGKTDIKAQAGSTVYYGENPPEEADVWINPNGEATDADPQNATIITCESEGESIHINDSAELPMKKLSVLGKTKQLKSTGKNLIPYPYFSGETRTANGVTFTANDDGSVTVTGTASEKTVYLFCQDYTSSRKYPIEAGGYYLSFSTDIPNPGSVFMVEVYIKHSSGGFYIQTNYGKNYATVTEDMLEARIQVCQLIVYAGASLPSEGVTVYPMFEKGSTASPYEPYTKGVLSPSPDYPQPMNSAGKDGSIDVEISNVYGMEIINKDELKSQSMYLYTPNGLPGVPVNFVSLGVEKPSEVQYVDENGQQWVCDEIDFDRGVYIKRVEEYALELSDVYGDAEAGFYSYISPPFELLYGCSGGLCEKGIFGGIGSAQFDITGSVLDFYFFPKNYQNGAITTAEQVKELMNGAKMLLPIAKPIEKPLTNEQIEKFKKLIMYKPNTTISNNDGAHIAVEYIADAKTYIDNKFAELQKAIVANV